jgi:RNA polymerase sigma-70 factor (ECF subfamily)
MERPPTNPAVDSAPAPPRPSFRALFQQVVDGSEEAAHQLQRQYGQYIVMAVRQKLSRHLRSKFDSVDFVQDVWVSFFREPDRAFESPEHLIGYLVNMAKNKVTDANRNRLHTEKRDVRREEPLAGSVEGQERQQAFAHDGTPSEAAISREMWQQMLEGQPPAYRKVLAMLRDGWTQEEVADELNLCRRTVQRIHSRALQRVRK